MKLELISICAPWRNRRSISKCRFTGEVTNIIARYISKLPEYQDCEIISMGPFGICATCTVLIKRNDDYIGSLTVDYGTEGKFNYVDYNAPKTNAFKPGTIGDMNGLNHPRKPLPASMDEILNLIFSGKGR